jgi:hypothetical protein
MASKKLAKSSKAEQDDASAFVEGDCSTISENAIANAITIHDIRTEFDQLGCTVVRDPVAIVKSVQSDTGKPSFKIYFQSAVSMDQLDAINQLCRKKKFCKLLNKGKFQEAQTYAERKFKGF